MAIKDQNKRNLDNFRTRTESLLENIQYKGLDQQLELIIQKRGLRQFMVGLATAVIGITFPQLIGQNNLFLQDLFFISLTLFSLVVVLGLLTLVPVVNQEVEEIPLVNKHYITQAIDILSELKEIEKMENNDEAGRRFQRLQKEIRPYPMNPPGFVEKFFAKYTDVVMLASFFNAFSLLFLGLVL